MKSSVSASSSGSSTCEGFGCAQNSTCTGSPTFFTLAARRMSPPRMMMCTPLFCGIKARSTATPFTVPNTRTRLRVPNSCSTSIGTSTYMNAISAFILSSGAVKR